MTRILSMTAVALSMMLAAASAEAGSYGKGSHHFAGQPGWAQQIFTAPTSR